MEKVLDHGDGDMIEMLLKEGIKHRDKYFSFDEGRTRTSWRIRLLLVIPTTPRIGSLLILTGRLKSMSFSLPLTHKTRKGVSRIMWDLSCFGTLLSKIGLSSIAFANLQSPLQLFIPFPALLFWEVATMDRF